LNRFVVDASVAVKWLPLFSHEPLVDAALYYLNRWCTRDLEFLVPSLFWIQVASVLWKTVHHGFCDGAKQNQPSWHSSIGNYEPSRSSNSWCQR
jgi:hypothetical protein